MGIDKQDLYDIVYKNLCDYSESPAYKNNMENPDQMRVMAGTMQSYFEENTEITYGWQAQLPDKPYTSDPVTSFVSKVEFSTWDLSRPMSLPGLAAKIMAAVSTGVIKHPSGFSVTPGSFNILPLTLPQNKDAEKCLMKCIVEPVFDWYLTLINPASLSGSHAAFVGATTSMAIN
jgi:hypothetical protein